MEFGIRSLKLLLSFSPSTVFCRDRLHLGAQTQIDTNHLSKHLCRSNVPALARADNVSCQVKTMLAAVKLLINISRNRGKWTVGLTMPQVWLRSSWQEHFFFSPTNFHSVFPEKKTVVRKHQLVFFLLLLVTCQWFGPWTCTLCKCMSARKCKGQNLFPRVSLLSFKQCLKKTQFSYFITTFIYFNLIVIFVTYNNSFLISAICLALCLQPPKKDLDDTFSMFRKRQIKGRWWAF